MTQAVSMTAQAPTQLIESDEVTPKRNDRMKPATAADPKTPITTPIIAGCKAARIASATNRHGSAPSTERMPISNRRWTLDVRDGIRNYLITAA